VFKQKQADWKKLEEKKKHYCRHDLILTFFIVGNGQDLLRGYERRHVRGSEQKARHLRQRRRRAGSGSLLPDHQYSDSEISESSKIPGYRKEDVDGGRVGRRQSSCCRSRDLRSSD
jgi:hypothetical protein